MPCLFLFGLQCIKTFDGTWSVCLSIYASSRTTGYKAAYERYLQLQSYKYIKVFPETTAFERYGEEVYNYTRAIHRARAYVRNVAQQFTLDEQFVDAAHLNGKRSLAISQHSRMQKRLWQKPFDYS